MPQVPGNQRQAMRQRNRGYLQIKMRQRSAAFFQTRPQLTVRIGRTRVKIKDINPRQQYLLQLVQVMLTTGALHSAINDFTYGYSRNKLVRGRHFAQSIDQSGRWVWFNNRGYNIGVKDLTPML